jgi:hypothetical protein
VSNHNVPHNVPNVPRATGCCAASPPPPGPPITPIIPINLLDQNGFPVRNDNTTNFAYVGPNDGKQQVGRSQGRQNDGMPCPSLCCAISYCMQARPPIHTYLTTPCRVALPFPYPQQAPEVYHAYHPSNPADPSPIDPGETAQLKNAQTGKFCRIAQLPASYISSPTTCNTQGVICDQDTIASASILTYTGNGMSYNGVPLVQVPPSNTLLLSSDPACTVPGGDKITFPPAVLCEFD